MARRGALTALQAVLAGIGGGASGYIQQEEMKRKRFQEEQDRELRNISTMLTLREAGAFEPTKIATDMTADDRAKAPPPTASPIRSALDQAFAGTSPDTMAGAQAGRERYETGGPGATSVSFGGRTMVMPPKSVLEQEASDQKFSDTMRLARAQEDERAKLSDVKNRGFYQVWSKRYGKNEAFDPNLPYKELIDLEESAAGRASTERAAGARAAAASAGGQPAFGTGLDYSRDLQTIDQFVPSERTENGKKVTVAPQRRLDSIRLAIVREAQSGDVKALGAMLTAQRAGQDFTNEMAYYTTAAGIAQAYAIQEQRGRNVSDLDIKNRVRQITIQPEEVGNPEVELLKASRLRQWARALQTGMIPQVQAGQTSAPPRLGVPFAQAGGQAGLPTRSSFTTGMAGLPYNASDF